MVDLIIFLQKHKLKLGTHTGFQTDERTDRSKDSLSSNFLTFMTAAHIKGCKQL